MKSEQKFGTKVGLVINVSWLIIAVLLLIGSGISAADQEGAVGTIRTGTLVLFAASLIVALLNAIFAVHRISDLIDVD